MRLFRPGYSLRRLTLGEFVLGSFIKRASQCARFGPAKGTSLGSSVITYIGDKGTPFQNCTFPQLPIFGAALKIRRRHAVQSPNHPEVRVIFIANCKVGGGLDIIRRITNTRNL